VANLNNIGSLSTADLLNSKSGVKKNTPSGGEQFANVLKKSISETNSIQVDSQKAMADIATGQVKDLHQAAIAIDKAENSMKLMLEVRNKALTAYKEILRTQM